MKTKILSIIVNTFLWLSSAFFILFLGLLSLFTYDWALHNFLFILAGILILPPSIRFISRKTKVRLRYSYIILSLFCVILFIAGIATLPLTQETFELQIERLEPKKSTEAKKPKSELSYKCGMDVESIEINGEKLSKEEKKLLCEEHYPLKLEDGDNIFEITFYGRDGIVYTEELVIKFDAEEYKDRLEAKKENEVEEEEQQQKEEEEKVEEIESTEEVIKKPSTEKVVKDVPTEEKEPTEKEEEETDEVAIGKQNALASALDYLSYTAFSYDGLIGQLKYEGYTHEEALYAVDNCGADWDKQALDSALNYLDYSAFSHEGLVGQLKHEGFTHEEATYAADNCGADWYEQAAQKAQDYMDYSSFSREGLIEQLKYEGFTQEQAEYGAEAVGY